MRLFHHYHRLRTSHAVRREFWLFEFSIWIHMVARSLIGVFLPILMLRLGYSVSAVIVYNLIFNLADVPLNFLARRLTRAWGAKAVIITATLASILYFAIFYHLGGGSWILFFGLAMLDGLYDAFYWVSHYYLFIESSGRAEDAGRNTGIFNSVRSFGGMLGPALGGVILISSGQNMLILTSIALFILSILPLIPLRHLRNKPAKPQLSFRKFFADMRERRDYTSLFLWAVHGAVEDTLWPMFIFVIFGTLHSIAGVALVISFSTIIFSYVTGRLSRRSRDKLVIGASIPLAAIWILRLFIAQPVFYYASIAASAFFATLVSTPLEANVVERAAAKDSLSAATYRNTAYMFSRLVFFGILALLVGVFKISFVIAAGSLFGLMILEYLLSRRMKIGAVKAAI